MLAIKFTTHGEVLQKKSISLVQNLVQVETAATLLAPPAFLPIEDDGTAVVETERNLLVEAATGTDSGTSLSLNVSRS